MIKVRDIHAQGFNDSASNSEIVVPVRTGGEIIGVLDIDSPLTGRFSENDREGLEMFAAALERILGPLQQSKDFATDSALC